jgi:hypothetical protein
MSASSVDLVREGLYETIAVIENSLERFIIDRNDGIPLQQAVDGLQQIRGVLNVVELASAELLVHEMMSLAMGIPVGAGDNRDEQLAALGSGLHILRRHLETFDARFAHAPELLLPAINTVRQASASAPLPESFFFSALLDCSRSDVDADAVSSFDGQEADLDRLRHMYQVGLLGFCRNESAAASLQLMERALVRLQPSFSFEPSIRLCWIASAAVESMRDGRLVSQNTRKRLFAQVDRELRACIRNDSHESPGGLLKELLYLVALANTDGPRSRDVRTTFALPVLQFNDHELQEEYARLAKPGRDVMLSLASAVGEEIALIKDLLDLVERGAAGPDGIESLSAMVSRLAKTLNIAGMQVAAEALRPHVRQVSPDAGMIMAPYALTNLAHTLLEVESQVMQLKRDYGYQNEHGDDVDALVSDQLALARESVLHGALEDLARTRGAICTFIDTQGERQHLDGVSEVLQSVRGGFWFLGEEQAATLVSACERYVREHMMQSDQMPDARTLETLADALTSLEYFVETGSQGRQMKHEILEVASSSLRALNEEARAA